jgi:thiol-disulfide isomerase/thioredoxin
VQEGSYIDLATFQQDPARYASTDVVLFFNASWCPTCRAAEASFSQAAFPAGLTVVSIDFDDNTALRQQYGVTVQHTFVQIDAAGEDVAKWSGSSSVAELAEQVV